MTVESTESHPPRGRIVIAYDGSEHAERAVRRAGELFPGRSALIVTAWIGVGEAAPELLFAPGGVIFATVGAVSDVMRERAQELCDEGARLAAEAGLAAEGRAVHSRHAMWEGIVRCADEHDADAIVVGARGHAPIVAAMLGSVSTGVLHHAKRPVLVVPKHAEGDPATT